MNTMRRLSKLIAATSLVLTLAANFGAHTVRAYQAGQPGKLTLSPSTYSATTGQNFTIDVKLNTGGQAISGAAMRLTYPVPATPDLEVVSVVQNNSLGLIFPFSPSATVDAGKMVIDAVAMTTAQSGYTSSGDVTLVTITLRANKAFSNKAFTFDQSQSLLTKKSDASDVLGTLGTASVTATGTTVPAATPSPGASPTPTTSSVASPTPTTSTGTTPTPTTAASTGTTPTPDAIGGGTVGDTTMTTTTTQTQPLPVSGSTTTTLAMIALGFVMVIGAVYVRARNL